MLASEILYSKQLDLMAKSKPMRSKLGHGAIKYSDVAKRVELRMERDVWRSVWLPMAEPIDFRIDDCLMGPIWYRVREEE